MSKEKESDRFRRLANDNLELVYEAIEISEEPWWGFGILANFEFFNVRNKQRTTELLKLRSQHIIEAIRTSPSPWDITWSLPSYRWFF